MVWMRKESKDVEFKERITKSYLKTVSAYSNYKDGKIIFGIKYQLVFWLQLLYL